ncbi:MAG: hypothetical protein ACOYXC_08435 [Candidatus Rifleibacteriota bacterium]
MSRKTKNHKTEKKHRRKRNERNLIPVQTGLPGFENDKLAVTEVPVQENSLADSVFNAQRKKIVNHLLSMVLFRYVEAETIVGIKTETGFRIRQKETPDSGDMEIVAEALFRLFKTIHQNDLHPLFPTILEELGFASDEQRVLVLWNDFWPETLKKLFRKHPSLINLLAGRLFPNDEKSDKSVDLQKIILSLLFTNIDS